MEFKQFQECMKYKHRSPRIGSVMNEGMSKRPISNWNAVYVYTNCSLRRTIYVGK